jgi:hypothetical protein
MATHSRFHIEQRGYCGHAPSAIFSRNLCIAELKAWALIMVRRLCVNLVEPPSCHNTIVLIGRNNRGQWVAREQNGLYGGLFVSRAAAVRYALFENGHHPEAIITCANSLELDMGATPSRTAETEIAGADALPRRAA